MKISVTDITYDLYDKETNPDNSILPEDLELPQSMIIEQKAIDELYGEDFNIENNIKELITCHTGFDVSNFKYEVISS
jgi:hypothetical protein